MNTEDIIGYKVSSSEVGECVAQIGRWIEKKQPKRYFVCANPHSLVTADADLEFSNAIQSADLVTADGVGILIASKIMGGSIRNRVTGTDVFNELNHYLNTKGDFTCFFLGSSEETLSKIVCKMGQDYANINIVGTYSPPYKSQFDDDDNEKMVKAINKVKPDVLWVGMTAPKQEKWIHQNIDLLEIKFAGAIGAVFDFYAGNVKRSHPFFQKIGLEWLPRLLQEPRRLWRRNFISSPLFLAKVFRQKCVRVETKL